MLFYSFEFLVFLPLVVCCYFGVHPRFRWAVLLTASYYFYACWEPTYLLLIIVSTLINFFVAIWMERSESRVERDCCLVLCLTATLGILFGFKYFNFTVTTINELFKANLPITNLLLPVGISFYTFQTLSYTLDVYRKEKKAETHLGIFALYVSFFPQLVAGPIERSTRLLPQFYEIHQFDYDRMRSGIRLIFWGLFKKVVIADRLAFFVNQVYNSPHNYNGISLLIATFFFAFQIYCDFSGYSDIAVGSARIMGYDLMINFNRPYFSKNVSEFWRRWHISLSSWFRDYLYIPLGGSRCSRTRWVYNIAVVFLLSGLWHGAEWTFVIWGGLHGSYLIFSNLTRALHQKFVFTTHIDRFPKVLNSYRVVMTFLLVSFAWIFFRANNTADAFYIIGHLFSGLPEMLEMTATTVRIGLGYIMNASLPHGAQAITQLKHFIKTDILLGQTVVSFAIAIASILFMEGVHIIQRHKDVDQILYDMSACLRWGIYYLFIMVIILFGVFERSQFIYFQF